MSDLENFLIDAFGDEEGWVYAPSENLVDGSFHKHWYKWPDERWSLRQDVENLSDHHNRYLSPVLYSDKHFTFKMSNFVWADFDNGLPNLGTFSPPSWRICSGGEGKEHWYWELTMPIRDKDQLEDYNRRVSRAFGGDKVAWNYNRVLRPIGSLNHKYDPPGHVTAFLQAPSNYTESFDFEDLPEVPRVNPSDHEPWESVGVPDLSAKLETVRDSLRDYVLQPTPEHRAQALFSIAKSLHEYGWTRDEILSLLSLRATYWRKWDGRADRSERLTSLYSSAVGDATVATDRGTNENGKATGSNPEADHSTGVTTLELSKTSDILLVDDNEDWILKDLLAEQGFMIMTAAPGIGKTTMALNLMLALATANPWLSWPIQKTRKTLFFSLEMNQKGLKKFVGRMVNEYPNQIEAIDANLDYYNGYSYRLNLPENREKLLATLDAGGYDGIVFDSLSRISDDLNDKASIDVIFDFISEELQKKRGLFVILIHHNGKGSTQGDQRSKMEKIYGSQFISAWVDTQIVLERAGEYNDPGIKFFVAKSRYSEYLSPITCARNENLILKVVEERFIK